MSEDFMERRVDGLLALEVEFNGVCGEKSRLEDKVKSMMREQEERRAKTLKRRIARLKKKKTRGRR